MNFYKKEEQERIRKERRRGILIKLVEGEEHRIKLKSKIVL